MQTKDTLIAVLPSFLRTKTSFTPGNTGGAPQLFTSTTASLRLLIVLGKAVPLPMCRSLVYQSEKLTAGGVGFGVVWAATSGSARRLRSNAEDAIFIIFAPILEERTLFFVSVIPKVKATRIRKTKRTIGNSGICNEGAGSCVAEDVWLVLGLVEVVVGWMVAGAVVVGFRVEVGVELDGVVGVVGGLDVAIGGCVSDDVAGEVGGVEAVAVGWEVAVGVDVGCVVDVGSVIATLTF